VIHQVFVFWGLSRFEPSGLCKSSLVVSGQDSVCGDLWSAALSYCYSAVSSLSEETYCLHVIQMEMKRDCLVSREDWDQSFSPLQRALYIQSVMWV